MRNYINLKNFFLSELDYIFFIYGLAFIILFAVLQSLKKLPGQSIKWAPLGYFAILHGLLEWSDLIALSLFDSPAFKYFRLFLMIASFLPIIEFARSNAKKPPTILIYLPLLFVVGYFMTMQTPAEANGFARYFILLPGGIWASLILIEKSSTALEFSADYKKIAFYLTGYTICAGIVVPISQLFPATVLNNDSFLEIFGFPVQLLRAFFAIGTAYSMWRLWRKINISKGLMFGVASNYSSGSIAAYSVLCIVFFGWVGLFCETHFILSQLDLQSLETARVFEIFKIASLALLAIAVFMYIQRNVTSRLHLDIAQKILEALFSSSPNPMFVKYANNKYALVNDSFSKLYGADKSRLTDSYDAEFTNSPLAKIRLKDSSSIHAAKEILQTTSGTKIFNTAFSHITLKHSRMTVGIMSDITALTEAMQKLEELNKNLEREVNARVEELRQKDYMLIQQSRIASMGEMISAIAHQWRQPLNSLGIMIQDTAFTYADNDMNEEYIKEFVKKAMQQINFMSKTIDDFRNFLKPDKEKTIFAPAMKIQEIIDILSVQLKNNNIQITVSKSQGAVEGYDKEFGQVILNILNNAKDAFLENKTQSPSIIVTESIQNNRFVVSIEDNAGGISEDIVGRVFEPYFSTKEEGKGTGIGLYISKMIIESNMGGTINVENVGSGARFIIELPLRALAA